MTADTKSCFKYSSFNISEKIEFYDKYNSSKQMFMQEMLLLKCYSNYGLTLTAQKKKTTYEASLTLTYRLFILAIIKLYLRNSSYVHVSENRKFELVRFLQQYSHDP